MNEIIDLFGLKSKDKSYNYEMLSFALLRKWGLILVEDLVKRVNGGLPSNSLPSWTTNATFQISTFGFPITLGYRNYTDYLDACLSKNRNNPHDAVQPQHHDKTHPDLVQVNFLSSSDDFWYFAVQCKLYTTTIEEKTVKHSEKSMQSVYEKFEKFGKMPVGSLQLHLLLSQNFVKRPKCIIKGNDVILYVDRSNYKNIFPDYVIQLLEIIIWNEKKISNHKKKL